MYIQAYEEPVNLSFFFEQTQELRKYNKRWAPSLYKLRDQTFFYSTNIELSWNCVEFKAVLEASSHGMLEVFCWQMDIHATCLRHRRCGW